MNGGIYEKLAEFYDELMGDVDYDAWAEYIHGLLQKAKIPVRKVFETACGTGMLSIRLRKMGYDVAASDISGEMLAEAEENARRAGVKLPFAQMDMRRLQIPRQDAVVCACDGVNYLLERREVRAFFSGAYAALREGGLLLFDVSSAYKLEHILGNELFYDDGETLTCFWQNRWDAAKRRVSMELTFFSRQEKGELYARSDEEQVQAAYTAEELKKMLAEAGFSRVEVYDFGTGNQPSAETERLQFAAVK